MKSELSWDVYTVELAEVAEVLRLVQQGAEILLVHRNTIVWYYPRRSLLPHSIGACAA